MRILIVEDEVKTARYLSKGLGESGYVVHTAADGEEGLLLALTNDYELLICDIMLPKYDGWSMVEKVRRAGRNVPIIFLTARDSVSDRVRGLDLGADDYLVKPYAFSELLARIRSVLRRGPARTGDVLRVGDLELDPHRHRATRHGRDLQLTAKEFALLSLLMRRRGEVLTRTVIAEQVWDIHFDTDTNVVDVAVRRLRQKVDDPFEQKLVRTVRGLGYVLEG